MNKKIHIKETKNDLLISKILSGIIILLFGLIGGVLLNKSFNKDAKCMEKKEEKVISIYDIDPIIKEYSEIEKSNVYLYNTNEILIDNKPLKEYIKKYKKIDDLFNSFKDYISVSKELKDGGTIIYETNVNKLFNKDLTIIRCHTEEGNNDIYFGEYMDTLTAFKNGACGKDLIDEKEIKKVYFLKKISLIEDHLYELVIVDEEKDKSITIKRTISDSSKEILKENKRYNFVFANKYQELIKNDIEDIFDKTTLMGVAPYEE